MGLFDQRQRSNELPERTPRYGILLVDDEILNLTSLASLLEDDYHVHIASNANDALQMLADPAFAAGIHLIVSDQRLMRAPRWCWVSGAESCRCTWIRTAWMSTPWISMQKWSGSQRKTWDSSRGESKSISRTRGRRRKPSAARLSPASRKGSWLFYGCARRQGAAIATPLSQRHGKANGLPAQESCVRLEKFPRAVRQ